MSYIQNQGAGGGGSGTVTNTGGALTSNAVVLGAGGNDTKVSTGITTNGASELDVGIAGGAAGVVGLNGSTSGKATFTAPAIAGTVTNPVVASNQISVPGVQLATQAGTVTGIYNSAASNVVIFSGATQAILFNASQAQIASGIYANFLGNKKFVTADFTTAASTALQIITGLSFVIPVVAFNFNFHCSLTYSQATANAAVAFGIQAATNAPTNIFANGIQQITTGPPATVVTGTLATLTTTTATNIVSGTPGATATNYVVHLDGTIELAASANTINFMVSTATAGDAVTVLRGGYAVLY